MVIQLINIPSIGLQVRFYWYMVSYDESKFLYTAATVKRVYYTQFQELNKMTN